MCHAVASSSPLPACSGVRAGALSRGEARTEGSHEQPQLPKGTALSEGQGGGLEPVMGLFLSG